MTTQTATGKLCTRGPKGYMEIPLSASMTDGTLTELTTDTNFSVTAQSVGIYGERQVLTGGFVSAKTGVSWAAIYNNGIIRAVIPITSRTAASTGSADMVVPNQITLNPGDQLMVMTYA